MKHRIKDILEEKHVLVKDLAAELKLSKVALSKFLNYSTPLTVDRAQQIADILDVEFWEIFYSREEMLNAIHNDTAGNDVKCPYCGKLLTLSIK